MSVCMVLRFLVGVSIDRFFLLSVVGFPPHFFTIRFLILRWKKIPVGQKLGHVAVLQRLFSNTGKQLSLQSALNLLLLLSALTL